MASSEVLGVNLQTSFFCFSCFCERRFLNAYDQLNKF